MNSIHKTAIASAALSAAVWAPPGAFSQDQLRDRVAAAVETVEKACGDDIGNFCGKVSRGEGRLLLCMHAHEDQLSFRCQFALYRASRRLENALHRVERLADACWNDIQAQCGGASRIGQCVVENRASLSKSCQTVVASLQRGVQGLASLKGMSVYSSDDKSLGQVVDVKRTPDGKIHSIRVEIGRFLGLGSKVVEITADRFEQLADRIKLRLEGDQVRSLPAAQNQ